MVKLFQMLHCDAEYFGLPLKAEIHKVTQMVTKGVFFTSVYYKSPIFVYQELFYSFEISNF